MFKGKGKEKKLSIAYQIIEYYKNKNKEININQKEIKEKEIKVSNIKEKKTPDYLDVEKNDSSEKIENFRLLIVGPSGSGKSQLVKKVLHKTAGTFDFIYLICPTHHEQDIYQRQIPYFNQNKENVSDKPTDEQFNKFIETIKKNKKNDKRSLLILDDILYTDITKVNSPLSLWITMCRHFNSSLIILSQLYKGIPPVIRINCTHYAFFYIANKNEVDKLKEEFGDTMLEKYKEYTLKPYNYLWINNTKNELSDDKYTDYINF